MCVPPPPPPGVERPSPIPWTPRPPHIKCTSPTHHTPLFYTWGALKTFSFENQNRGPPRTFENIPGNTHLCKTTLLTQRPTPAHRVVLLQTAHIRQSGSDSDLEVPPLSPELSPPLFLVTPSPADKLCGSTQGRSNAFARVSAKVIHFLSVACHGRGVMSCGLGHNRNPKP